MATVGEMTETAGEMTEDDIDWYMLAASQKYEAEIAGTVADGGDDRSSSRFGPIVDSDELREIVHDSVPQKTRQHTRWCVDTWSEWRESRIARAKDSEAEIPPKLIDMDRKELDHWLSCFVVEARRKDGSPYVGETLQSLVCGIQRHVRLARPDFPVDFLSGAEFRGLRGVLDARMKGLRKSGVGLKRKQAEPITYEEEGLLWEGGHLGDSSPQTLLDTMVWMCGLYFALRSGVEHRGLTVEQLDCRDNKIIYTEAYSKNHQGGLAQRHDKQKVVQHYANQENPSRCFIRLYQKYRSLCPPDVSAFYLTPLQKPRRSRWFSKNPVGHNTLGKTVSRLCQLAGIQGFRTNHSLRATAATRLYHGNTDEQLIMTVTGHKSSDGVRSYKRTSDDQFKSVSSVLCKAPDQLIGGTTIKENTNTVANILPSSPSLSVSGCGSVVINIAKNHLFATINFKLLIFHRSGSKIYHSSMVNTIL